MDEIPTYELLPHHFKDFNMKEKVILEHVQCDLCGCNEYKQRYRLPDMWLWVNQFEFPVVECNGCGLVFVNPRPTQESMSQYYPKDYHQDRNSEEHQIRYRNQSKFIPDLNHKKVLDIGCARGDFLGYLMQEYPSMTPYGVDYFSNKLDYKDIIFFNKLFFECGFENNFFDVIVSFAVFEHLHEPSLYFKESNRVLKQNGELIILVTNSESLYGKKAKIEDVPRHTYHFSEKTLEKYGQKYGFKLEQIYYDNSIFDGRGTGTFRWMVSDFLKISYEDYYFKRIDFLKRICLKVASLVDKVVFSTHWEKTKKQSGIIIARFVKC